MDIIYIVKRPIFYAVNEAMLFQAARFLANMQARITWNMLRAIWINIYINSSDIIVINAGTNFVNSKFVNNVKIIFIEIEEIPVKAHYFIGKIEKYHAPVKRAFEIITANLSNTITPEHVLQMAVKAVNDTAGPDGLVPTLLVFGTFPRISHESPPSPSITARGEAMRKAMAEVHKLKV
jgi:hypothetical protein